MASDNLIVVIDDSPTLQLSAEIEVRKETANYVIPTTPQEVREIPASKVGLLILDKHMDKAWQVATDNLLRAVPATTLVVEWSIDEMTPRRKGTDDSIGKRLGAITQAVRAWKATQASGSVLKSLLLFAALYGIVIMLYFLFLPPMN